jgi:predicted metal-dependent HD superfamily phosphohydrolase
MTSSLQATRFDALWRRCAPTATVASAAAVHSDLCRRLSGPDRRFHDLRHIEDCLSRFDEVAPLLVDPDAVELGLWFHDAVYVPSDPDNERNSVRLYLAQSTGAPPAFRRRVCGLILATRHKGRSYGNDRRFIEDIDLAGFAAPWQEFMRQGDLLREEFAAQTDAQYHSGQVRFLEGLRQRKWFFSTGYFRDRYEASAQANLARLLADLAQQGYRAPSA